MYITPFVIPEGVEPYNHVTKIVIEGDEDKVDPIEEELKKRMKAIEEWEEEKAGIITEFLKK